MAQKYKILVVDDDHDFFEDLSISLSRYDLDHAANTKSAGIMLRNHNYDLVLLDLNLDEKNEGEFEGLEYIKKVKDKYPIVPVIVMSSYDGYDEIMTAIRNGAADYFRKNVTFLEVWRNRIQQVISFKRLMEERYPFVGASEYFAQFKSRIESLSQTDHPVLFQGGIGSGKTSAARYFHSVGKRRNQSFHNLDINLYQNEDEVEVLFEKLKGGIVYIKGIDRVTDRAQAFFLDQIRKQKEGGAKRNIQFLASTHLNLKEMVNKHEFRADLYYSFTSIEILPLRDQRRQEDIVALINYYLQERDYKGIDQILEPKAKQILLNYSYPNNISELRGHVAYMLQEKQLQNKSKVDESCLPRDVKFSGNESEELSLSEFRKASTRTILEFIDRALKQSYGQKGKAAELLDIKPDDLRYMVIKYHREYPDLTLEYDRILKTYNLRP